MEKLDGQKMMEALRIKSLEISRSLTKPQVDIIKGKMFARFSLLPEEKQKITDGASLVDTVLQKEKLEIPELLKVMKHFVEGLYEAEAYGWATFIEQPRAQAGPTERGDNPKLTTPAVSTDAPSAASAQSRERSQIGVTATSTTAAAVNSDNADEQLPYSLAFPKRGKVIIICITEFHDIKQNVQGIARDGDALNQFFLECGFEVQFLVNRNCESQEMFCKEAIMDHLKEEANKDYGDHAMLVCAIVSHGGIEDNKCYLDDYEGQPIYNEKIVELFKRSESLSGKPKVFIFHACRGTEEEKRRTVAGASQQPQYLLPQFTTYAADILIFYSTVKGHLSYFRKDATSLFVNTLLRWLRTSKRDALSVFTDVIREIATSSFGCVHTPCIESTLTRALYIGCNSYPIR